MLLLTWLDHQKRHRELKFMIRRDADMMKTHLENRNYTQVKITEFRRDVHNYNPQTDTATLLAANILLSQLSVEIREFLTDNPEVSLFITPPSTKPKTG